MAAVDIPLLSIIDATVSACDTLNSVGLLATEGCLRSGAYQSAMRDAHKDLVLPNESELQSFMDLTFRIKHGDKGEDVAAGMLRLSNALQERGAQAIIAGCTEIPLVMDKSKLDIPLISSTDELAKLTIACARGERALDARE